MKQHITPKQAKQLTETQFYSLFDEIVPRADWSHFHHKKVTIGKLIESLGHVTIIQSHTGSTWEISLPYEPDVTYQEKELVDALWNAAVVWVRNRHQAQPSSEQLEH